MNAELESVLQSHLVAKVQEWQQLQRQYPELALTSVHIAPDGAWISLEHEEITAVYKGVGTEGQIVRKSPACHTTITKI